VGHTSTGGKTPRDFGIDPTGSFLLAANQASDTVVVLRIDRQTGAPRARRPAGTGATPRVRGIRDPRLISVTTRVIAA
jgi:6-phosphogluconolactonase